MQTSIEKCIISKNRKKVGLVIGTIIFVLICSCLVIMFVIQQPTIEGNEIKLTDAEITKIEKHLESERNLSTFRGETCFSSIKVLGVYPTEDEKATVYVWEVSTNFIYKNGGISKDGGSSVPLTIKVDRNNADITILEIIQPRDGSFYVEDIEKMPKYVQQQIHGTDTIDQLSAKNFVKAEEHFKD